MAVFIKKSHNFIFNFNSSDYEFMYFELNLNSITYSLISGYKAPHVNDNDYLLA